jgi:NAD(P)-dependent dehydrogenase (short-subunit alcohol dehydrogenase family)
MMKMLAVELAQFKIRVNAVCPGYIETAMCANRRNTEGIRLPSEYPEGESSPLPTGFTGSQTAQGPYP